jgi:hypothetical protein
MDDTIFETMLNYVSLRFGSISESLQQMEQRLQTLENALAEHLEQLQARRDTRLA